MSNILITGFKNAAKEGITLIFNKPVSLNGRMAVKEWWLSWDKIGKALLPGDYADGNVYSVAELNEMRKAQ